VDIDMHPADPAERLDAITFSPHKFLGGPGSPGVLVFDSKLYTLKSPDQPGGGTVLWTNPWGKYAFIPDVEAREDGGTPAFLQAIKAALAIQLKEAMGTQNIRRREEQLVSRLFEGLRRIPHLHILAGHVEDRLGIFSFYLDDIHYNLAVKLLNDRFGIQVRGGCSCAGTYGHYLLHVSRFQSKRITDQIDAGDLTHKPGWVRLSVHPTMLDEEVDFLIDAVRQLQEHASEWGADYRHDPHTNEFRHMAGDGWMQKRVESWFEAPKRGVSVLA
jgi:selenocysteine lyase/cysteine desulfurase